VGESRIDPHSVTFTTKHDLDLCYNVLFPWPCLCHMQHPESMDDTDVDEDWEAVQV